LISCETVFFRHKHLDMNLATNLPVALESVGSPVVLGLDFVN